MSQKNEDYMSYDEYLVRVKEGILTKDGHCPVTPPHVEYSLSGMGKDLFPVFYSIMNWGFKHEKEIYEAKEDK